MTAITRGFDGKLHGNFHEQYFNSTQIGRAYDRNESDVAGGSAFRCCYSDRRRIRPDFLWLVMKKDHELPWVIRLGRRAFFVLGTLLAGGYVAHCFKEWFL